MLANFGFLDRAGLTGMARAWRELYRLVRPDLLVIDHSPTALLAARGTGLRRVLLGTRLSFTTSTSPMPSLRPWLDISPSGCSRPNADRRDDERGIGGLGGETARGGWPTSSSGRRLPVHIPRAGPPPRTERDTGAPSLPRMRESPRVAGTTRRARLPPICRRPTTISRKLVSQLSDLSCGTSSTRRACQTSRSEVSRTKRRLFARAAAAMAQSEPRGDLVICHGGHGTTAASLLAAGPSSSCTGHVEQLLSRRRLFAGGWERPSTLTARIRATSSWRGDICRCPIRRACPRIRRQIRGLRSRAADRSDRHRCEEIIGNEAAESLPQDLIGEGDPQTTEVERLAQDGSEPPARDRDRRRTPSA